MTYEDEPQLLAALFCRGSGIGDDGLPFIDGVLNQITMDRVVPDATVPFLVLLTATSHHRRPQLAIAVIPSGGGQPQTIYEAPVSGREGSIVPHVIAVPVGQMTTGRLWVVVSLDGREATRVPLSVFAAPEGEPT